MIFLDSSFIIAYKIEDDEHHLRAVALSKSISSEHYGEGIISDYIFDEIVTVIFNRTKKLIYAVQSGNELKKSVSIIGISKDLFNDSWKIFKKQKDTRLSFTDCTILALMKKKRISSIATFDKDFNEIEGITVIS